GDMLDGAKNRVKRSVAACAARLCGAMVADRDLGGAGHAALHVDLDVPQRKAPGCGSSQRFLHGELEVFGVKGTLPLGEAEDERVNRSKLLLVQLDSHAGQFLGETAA